MKAVIISFLITVVGCVHVKQKIVETKITRSAEYQQEIDTLLAADKVNKLLEEEYLREITIAQDNDDRDAYKFYIVEYVRVPRIPIPEWVKQEPGFYHRKSAADVMREYRNED